MGKGGTGLKSCLKRYDRYQEKVSLSYKNQSSFPTACGGVATIIGCTFLIYTLSVYIVFTLLQPSFSQSQKVTLTQEVNGSYPSFDI